MAHTPIPPAAAIKMSTLREVLFVFVCTMANFTNQAALGQALVPLPIIAQTFDLSNQDQAVWFVAGYSLTIGTFILISGRVGDILGHKRMFCFGYAWLGVWSAFAGFAAYPGKQVWFDICRALQGIGTAITLPNSLALLGAEGTLRASRRTSFSPSLERSRLLGSWQALFPEACSRKSYGGLGHFGVLL